MVTAVAGMVVPVPVVVVFVCQVGCPPRRICNFSKSKWISCGSSALGRYCTYECVLLRFEKDENLSRHFCFRHSAPVNLAVHPDGSLGSSRGSWPLWGLCWLLLRLAGSLLALSWAPVEQSGDRMRYSKTIKSAVVISVFIVASMLLAGISQFLAISIFYASHTLRCLMLQRYGAFLCWLQPVPKPLPPRFVYSLAGSLSSANE